MSANKFLAISLVLLSILFISCGSDSPVDPKEEEKNIPMGDFSLLSPEHESTLTNYQPTLKWQKVENPDNNNISYEIRLSTKNPPTTVITEGHATPEYELEHDLKPGKTYYWQVISNLSSGERFKSKEIYSFTYMEETGTAIIVNDDLGMPLRYSHSLEFFDNKLWFFAGLAEGHEQDDIWYSEDGIQWDQGVDANLFHPRLTHTSLVYNDKMWILGGTVVGRFFSDVWNTDDGLNWNEVTDSAPFGMRYNHSSSVFDDKMWVIGGHVISQDMESEETVNNVWYSTDGENWTQATENADFQPRLGHQSVVFDDKLWVIGGLQRTDDDDTYFKDVWYSENGVDWTLATDDIGIGDILDFESIVYDDKIWIIGGIRPEGNVSNDIWYSSDGINWEKAPPFFGRVDHAVTVFQDKIWGVGGGSQDSDYSDVNDSWYLNVP